jgi:hypothetical protein
MSFASRQDREMASAILPFPPAAVPTRHCRWHRLFQRDNEMKNIVLSDPEVRAQAIRHFFARALREAREARPT